MNSHQRTLVVLSGTESDRQLVVYARLLAAKGLSRHFHFVHVRTPASMLMDLRTDEEVLETCQSLIADVFASPKKDVSSSCHVVIGVRIDTLVEFVLRHRCDLVLLGHRRNQSDQRSLPRRLAMIAPCSVWVVPEGATASISNIMVPVDFSEHSADGLSVAATIAKAAGLSECVAMHVFSNPSVIRNDENIDEIRKNEQESFEKFIQQIDRQGINIEPAFMEGNNVGGTLLHAAQQHHSDLIVMNTRGRSRAASILLGSVTSQVMDESPIAVLVVKHFGAMLNLFQALQQSQIWTRPTPKTN